MRILRTMGGEGLRERIQSLFRKKGTTYELQSMGADNEDQTRVGLVFPEPKRKKSLGGYKIGLSDSPVNERALKTAKAIAHDATIYFDIENPFLVKPEDNSKDALDSCVAAVCAPPKLYSDSKLTDLIEQALKTPGTSVVLQGTYKGSGGIYGALKAELKPNGEAVGLSMEVSGIRKYVVMEISRAMLDFVPLDLERAVVKLEEYYLGRVRRTFNGAGERIEDLDYALGSGMQSVSRGLKFLYMHSGLPKLGEWSYEQISRFDDWAFEQQKKRASRKSAYHHKHKGINVDLSFLKNACSGFLVAASVPLIFLAKGTYGACERFDEKLFRGIRESVGEFGDARRRVEEERQKWEAQRQNALLQRIRQLGIQPNADRPSCVVIVKSECL